MKLDTNTARNEAEDERRRRAHAFQEANNYSVPRAIGWVIAAMALLWLIYQLWAIILVIIVALIFAGTFRPMLASIERRGATRRTAMILLVVGLSLGAALLATLTFLPLVDQFAAIVHDLPAQRERLIAALGRHEFSAPLGRTLNSIGLDQGFARLQKLLLGYSSDIVLVAGYAMTAFSLTLYFLADGKRTQGSFYAVVPRAYHMRLARIIYNLEDIVGGYMRGQLITSVACAAFTFVLLTLCGVRSPMAIALLAGLFDVVPFVGGILATGPAVLIALGHGDKPAAVVLVCMLVYQSFENRVLVPRIYKHALRLSPAAVIIALLAGGTLLGVIGALLALPIAAALQMIVKELGVEMPGDDSSDPKALDRDRKTEAAYEAMSAGATAHDAGQIASHLARDLRDAEARVAESESRKTKLPTE